MSLQSFCCSEVSVLHGTELLHGNEKLIVLLHEMNFNVYSIVSTSLFFLILLLFRLLMLVHDIDEGFGWIMYAQSFQGC